MEDNHSPYFYGSAENKLNSKGQVAIPAKLRSFQTDDEQSRTWVILRGEATCLYMYTHRQFGKIKENARRVAEETGDSDFFRSFMAEAHSVEVDSQWRFVLPGHFIDAARIVGPGVLFIGVDDRIEIWEPKLYAASIEKTSKYEEQRRTAARKIFGI